MAHATTRRSFLRRTAGAAALGALAWRPGAARAADSRASTLIVRADDLGSSHAANLACIESYRNGIARAVEIMMPCAWVPEAVKLLAEDPGLDAGVHLTLT